MEETGFESKAIIDTRNKLNKLSVFYDFLKEYAYGKEEFDSARLDEMLKLVGATNLSNRSGNIDIQSLRDTMDINEVGGCLDFIRVYINDETQLSSTIAPYVDDITIKIYGSNTVSSMSVTLTVTDTPPVVYTGTNYVTIESVNLDEISDITLEITTTNICGEMKNKTMNYSIQEIADTELYWVGTTTERFTIGLSDINESTNITIDPNSGSNVGGTQLTYTWVNDALAMIEYAYLEDKHFHLNINTGDAHALIVVPTSLTVENIGETVFGTNAPMTEGIHYDIFQITNGLKTYNVYYFRDLTSFVFPTRQFQFDVVQ